MRVILMSDLHIKPNSNAESVPWVKHFCTFMKSTYYPQTLVFVLGDVIDKGSLHGHEAFAAAEQIFTYIASQLSSVRYQIAFIPGNHDYCEGSLGDFIHFCHRHQTFGSTTFDFTQRNTWNCPDGNFNFIFADSVQDGKYDLPGCLNIPNICECMLSDKKNVLLMHHSLLFEDASDHTGIIEQPEVISFLNKRNIEFVFHGHAHATRDFHIGEKCVQYGSGSIGKGISGLTNEDEQFLEIQINGRSIEAIANWLWRGGTARYKNYLLYPEAIKQYESGELIERKIYAAPENYIERYIMLRELASIDELTRYLSREKQATLFEACQKDRLVILIADAGLGKTIEMEYLAHIVSKKNPYMRPILLPLNVYNGEPLQAYINLFAPEYKTLDPDQFLLIMDGYDELAQPESFKRALSQYVIRNHNTHICISMRSNFLSSNSTAFQDFSVYQLLELENSDIQKELLKNSIDKSAFWDECYRKNLHILLPNPFYLEKLIEIYLVDKSLPKQTELMNRFLTERFSKDIEKFEFAATTQLEECQYEVERALLRFAYGLQLLDSTACNEETYQTIIEKEDRQYIKCSSLTINSPHGHSFSHNIFREYLLARYLSKTDHANIIMHISIPGTKYLNPSWFNILGFILQLNPYGELIDWLREAEPLALTMLEPDRVSIELRYSILDSALSNIVNKNIWFRDEICSEENLAVFSQSSRAVELLLNHIKAPAHFRSLSFCLSVLSCFTDLFEADDRVCQALIDCYRCDSIRVYEKRIAISAIAALRLNTPEITEDLVKRFAASRSSYERLGVYEYLLQANQINEKVDFLLSGLKNISYTCDDDEISNGSEHYTLTKCLNGIDKPIAIENVILWYSHEDNMDIDFYEKEKLFSDLFDKASEEYNKGFISLFEAVYTFFINATRQYSRYHISDALRFFTNTGTMEIAFERFACEDAEDRLFMIEDAIHTQPNLIDLFCRLYIEDRLQNPDLLRRYALRWQHTQAIFQKCAAAIQVRTGEILAPPAPTINYEQLRQRDTQTFFDCLFNSDNMQGLLTQLATLYENLDITCRQLRDMRILRENYPAGTHMLEITLIQSSFEEERVIDFIGLIDWDFFFINRVCYLFNNEKTMDSLIISDVQREVLSEVYYQLEKNLNYHTALEEPDINSFRFSREVHSYMILKDALSLPSPDSYYLGLLEIPCHFVNKKSNIGEKYNLIERHIAPNAISERIATLVPQETRISILDDLMFGCKRYHVKSCKDSAIQMCAMNTITAYHRKNALDYLLELFESDLILDEVMPAADDSFFELIVNMLRSEEDERLKAEMLRRNKKAPSRFLLKNLIYLNVQEGLQAYIDASREAGGAMNHANDNGEVTEAISAIHDIKLLPLLLDAVRLRFSDSFKDGSFHTLYSSLQNALSTCAKSDFNLVWRSVDELKAELCANLEAIGFCNLLQNNILESNKMALIKELSVPGVRDIIRQVK